MTAWKRWTIRLGYSVAIVIILAATAVSIGRLLTPVFDRHLPDFEVWANQTLQTPVKIGKAYISWDVYRPEITFDQVSVLDPKTQQPKINIDRIRLDLYLIQSLLSGKPVLKGIIIRGVNLTVHQVNQTQMHVEGLNKFVVTDNLSGASVDTNGIVAWLLSRSYLILRDINLNIIPFKGETRSVTLSSLVMSNSGSEHHVTGQIALNQAITTQANIDLTLNGDVLDPAHLKARLYMYLEGVSLPQWLNAYHWNNLQVRQGVGSAKVWLTWKDNQLDNLQTKLQFYQLSVESLSTKKITTLSRLSGNLGWKREGNKMVFAGDDVLIDLPNHLWPMSRFTLEMIPNSSGAYVPDALHVGYLDLADLYHVALDNDLVPVRFKPMLAALNLHGEVTNLFIKLNNEAWSDPANINAAGDFTGVSINPWQEYPAVANLQGKFNWNGKQGDLTLDSHEMTVVIKQVFAAPLSLSRLLADVIWQQDATGNWIVTAKNTQLATDDATVNANVALTIPAQDSPSIDLTADFSLKDAAHVVRYLPLMIFDKELVEWLQNAFLSGHASGNIILKGRLKDFPFDDGKGQFVIGATAKDVNLHYGPGWPEIQGIDGNLLFSGRSMKIDVDAGHILNVPIKEAHAEIPYMGDAKPQILNVTGAVQTDMSNGLDFIAKSPLQATLGQDLEGLKLQGPMQLKLNLIVPLKKPEATQVVGDAQVTEATLSLPDWNVSLEKISGAFRFTEQGITAQAIQGTLFNEPVSLNLTTTQSKNNSHEIEAALQGNVAMNTLETWLQLPVTQYAQGKTAYSAKLLLPPHNQSQATQVTITSDLQGVALNLPASYGKDATATTPLQVTLTVGKDKLLKTKINYAKKFSAALSLQKDQQQFHIVNGELHLGTGEANWQTQPGLLLSADFDVLDWDTVQPYYEQYTAKKPIQTGNQKPLFNTGMVRAVDVRAKQIRAFGQDFKDMDIQVSLSQGNTLIDVESPSMAGQVILPTSSKQTIQAKFRHFYFTPADVARHATIDPKSIPPIDFVSDEVHYDNKALGKLSLMLRPSGGGLDITQLNLETANTKLSAKGDWQGKNGKYRSHLQGSLNITALTKVLQDLGYGISNLVGSTADMQFNFNWSDALFSPSIAKLSGTVSLKLGQGRIINLDEKTTAQMGLGRMLNVFSLQSIPRRLSLDFSDVFEKGYSFDYMKGDFTLQNGNAMTHNTRFDGPIARVDIVGRLGLVAKDYDIKLDVTPYVTSSLPVVATIAANLNPVAGVATWLVDKVVSRAVSNIYTYHYVVSGPWVKPEWTQVSTTPASKTH